MIGYCNNNWCFVKKMFCFTLAIKAKRKKNFIIKLNLLRYSIILNNYFAIDSTI